MDSRGLVDWNSLKRDLVVVHIQLQVFLVLILVLELLHFGLWDGDHVHQGRDVFPLLLGNVVANALRDG